MNSNLQPRHHNTFLPIETERLLLRIPEPGEAQKMVDYVSENRDHLLPWEPLRPETHYTLQHWQKELKDMHNEFILGQSARFSIFLKEGNPDVIIGVCNFTTVLRGAFQACFLGYSLDYRYQGQGVMNEALDAAVNFVFEHFKLHRVMANYMPRNERSGKLLKKLGFTVEGFARDYLKIAGEWEDHILTAKIC